MAFRRNQKVILKLHTLVTRSRSQPHRAVPSEEGKSSQLKFHRCKMYSQTGCQLLAAYQSREDGPTSGTGSEWMIGIPHLLRRGFPPLGLEPVASQCQFGQYRPWRTFQDPEI